MERTAPVICFLSHGSASCRPGFHSTWLFHHCFELLYAAVRVFTIASHNQENESQFFFISQNQNSYVLFKWMLRDKHYDK